ncbi:GNAT family N-acetyltransferase, partial [Paenibacillus sp. OT2-17]|nr:GNAT family N-acetyltransferase [Paenibacillus sp. OT2-17]
MEYCDSMRYVVYLFIICGKRQEESKMASV